MSAPSAPPLDDLAEGALVPARAIRARRRPVALVLVWAFEALAAIAMSWPIASYVDGAYGSHPRGDAALWRGGGLALVDLVFRAPRGVGSAFSAQLVFVVLAALLFWLVPLAALLTSLAREQTSGRAPTPRQALAASSGSLPPLFGLLVVFGVAQLVIVGVGFGVGAALAKGLYPSFSEVRAQQIGGAVGLAFGTVALVLCVAHDLARAAVIEGHTGTLEGARRGLAALRRTKVSSVLACASRTLAGFALVALGALAGESLGGRGGAALVALAAIHQLVVFGRVALRASWLAAALRTVAAQHDDRDEYRAADA